MNSTDEPEAREGAQVGQFGLVSLLQLLYILPALGLCLTIGVRFGWQRWGFPGALGGALLAFPVAILTVGVAVIVTVVGAMIILLPLAFLFDPESRREILDEIRGWRRR